MVGGTCCSPPPKAAPPQPHALPPHWAPQSSHDSSAGTGAVGPGAAHPHGGRWEPPQLTRTLFWGWQAAAQPCPASAHCPPTARRWGRTPSRHAGGGGGSQVLVTQRTMREAPEAPRVAGLLQRKREESVTHGTVPGACSHPHAHCWHGTPARTHPVTAHAAPRTPTIAHTHTGTAHVVPLTPSCWQGTPGTARTHTQTHTPPAARPRGTHRHTPTGYPQAHTPGHTPPRSQLWMGVGGHV